MKRFAFIAVLVMALFAVGAVAAFAAPGGPGRGFGMMGQGGFGMMGGMMGGTQGVPYGMMGGDRMMGDDLEALLGISHAEIHAAHIAGKSLVDIASEKGVTEDQLIKALVDGRKAALAQAVKDGKLTQDAADQMLQFMTANIKTMVEARGMSDMMGLMGGSGMMSGSGMMGRGQAAPGTQAAPRSGGCHSGQAPTQQGTDIRNNNLYGRGVQQQG